MNTKYITEGVLDFFSELYKSFYIDEDAENKMPAHAEKLSKVVHEMSTTGQKMFKEGRRIVNEVADTAEKNIDEIVKKSSETKKKSN